MPRTHRIDFPGARHHVYNRTISGELLFWNDDDRRFFLELLGQLPERHGLRIHGYALMPNHYHLMIESPAATLSRGMADFSSRLTRGLNLRHERNGAIFRGRFRNRVASYAHWRHLLAYLHLNPVPRHRPASPDDFKWTSHRAYMGIVAAPPWLTTSELLEMHGGADGLRRYMEAYRAGILGDPDGFDPEKLWQGGETDLGPGGPPEPEADDVVLAMVERRVQDVADVTGVPVESLWEAPRGRGGNPARWVLAWWLTRGGAMTSRRVATLFGCRPTGVSKMRNRLRRRAAEDPEVAGWIDELLRLERQRSRS
ncbi:MAG: hypothetical protein D6798_14125 [Deltaproteobacteria bacterium]|nr:MAG: hypothetical protein D6798_14125 [Deltaproteobacteria bacterium]